MLTVANCSSGDVGATDDVSLSCAGGRSGPVDDRFRRHLRCTATEGRSGRRSPRTRAAPAGPYGTSHRCASRRSADGSPRRGPAFRTADGCRTAFRTQGRLAITSVVLAANGFGAAHTTPSLAAPNRTLAAQPIGAPRVVARCAAEQRRSPQQRSGPQQQRAAQRHPAKHSGEPPRAVAVTPASEPLRAA